MLNEKTDLLYGNWSGVIKIAETEISLYFLIKEGLQGGLSVSLTSQGQTIDADDVSFNGQELIFKFGKIGAEYNGKFEALTSTIMGTWNQGNHDFELNLIKTQLPLEKPHRPQNPQKPYPYIEKEVVYRNEQANIKLGGTLTLPRMKPPYPAVILITGSGAEDRDETILGHKPFLVLADYLTRRGISVLRVDDRGVGASTGIFSQSTNADFASDVKAGIEFLKTQNEINSQKIGLIGHSEGGFIAPLVARNNSDVAFIVLMAGPGLPLEQILYMQAELISRAMNAKEELISKQRSIQEAMFSIVKSEKNLKHAEQQVRKVLSEALKDMKEQGLPIQSQNSLDTQIKMVLSPWFRDFISYDPKVALREVKCPVLALNGEKDLQVPPKENLAAIEQALQEGGNISYQIIELPNLNHLFQNAKTGAINEYAQIEETISPKALEVIGNWVIEQSQK